jgi:hypothetical protein
MKIICECGKEGIIHCPPMFLEMFQFVFGHRTPTHYARTVKAVCVCGEERIVGPGVQPEPRTQAQIILQGHSDREWFLKHASCGAN